MPALSDDRHDTIVSHPKFHNFFFNKKNRKNSARMIVELHETLFEHLIIHARRETYGEKFK